MVENFGANPQEDRASDGIPTGEILKRVSSIAEPRGKVEATRLSLQYLLAKGRPLDSLFLFQQIDAKKLQFNSGERDKMLNGILKTAEGLRKKDPIQAWDTIWNITYSKAKHAPYGESRDFTREEYERLNTQDFKDQQAATLARYIECYLNPDIEIKGRERFAREDISSHMNDTMGNLYDLDLDKIFDSLDKTTREKLFAVARDHPLSVLKRSLQARGETAGTTADQTNASAENIISMEGIFPGDLPKKLNELLSQNKNEPHITFSFSPDQLKEYIASIAEGFHIEEGKIRVGDDVLIIGNLRITINLVQGLL